MSEIIRECWERLRSFFRKGELERELESELSSHIEMAVEENLAKGMTPEESRRQALMRFGGVEQAKERHRESRGLPFLDSVLQDLRYTFRTLKRERGFTIVAILILGVGIGANTAVFSVVNTILLRPLPLANPQRLVWIAPPPTKCGFSCETYSADAYEEFRAENRSLQDVAGYFAFSTEDNYRLTGRGEPVPATGILVTGNFFQVLGIRPLLGRLFNADDTRKGSHPAVLLANAYWKRQFAADPRIIGKAIDLNGQSTTVVGVLPPAFDFGSVFAPGEKVDLFTPYILDNWRDDGNDLTMVGRLKPGVNLPQAQANANLVAPQLYFNIKYPDTKGRYKVITVTPLKKYVTGRMRGPLIMLWCAVGAILLIVCVNLSNLFLARAATRSKEFALRSALGAGRIRLVRQLLTESVILSAAGAVLGLSLAWAITAFLAHQGSIALPLLSDVRMDGAALAWTLVVAAVVAALFGAVPALKLSNARLHESLKDAGPGLSEGKGHERTRAVLVMSELALACVLLVGAGLLLRSFLRVLDVNLGFEPARAAAMKVDYDDGGSPAKRSVIFQRILSHIEAIPGVESAGMVDYLPLGQNREWGPVEAQGKLYREGEAPDPLVYVVTSGFFRAMGMRLLAGRDFSWDDGPSRQKVIIINQALARALWPNGSAVGQTASAGPWKTCAVIGVVSNVHETSIEGAAGWQIYYPATQAAPAGAELVVRTKLPPDTLAASVLRTLRQLNPNQPAAAFQPIQQIVDHSVSPRRFFMLLVLSFGLFGLILASLGIYGVVSYSVTRRTQEIGIRMALGASPAGIRLMVIRGTLRLALVGVGLGLLLSLALMGVIASLLFGIAPTDPLTFAATVVVLASVAVLAGYLPARRASRVEPMSALRAN